MTVTAAPLTPSQRAVVDIGAGSVLVTAPPGSGKTHVLVQRIVRLLGESAGANFRILALTFTLRAAEEMRSRIETQTGEEWRRVTACTFHSFSLDVLRHYGSAIGVAPDVTILHSDQDRREALARSIVEEGYDLPSGKDGSRILRELLEQIGRLKRRLVPAGGAPAENGEGVPVRAAYEAYDRTLSRYGVVDFDDLLMLAYRLFVEHPRIARHYRRMFRYILIDEAQDTSRAQYGILRALCGDEHRNVMLVADADQSIFRFAGASSEYLNHFLADFDARRIELPDNFRCGDAIVRAANSLIARNPDRPFQPEMISATRAPGHVKVLTLRDEEEEATAVADRVEWLLEHGLREAWVSDGEERVLRPWQICVMARTRYSLSSVLDRLDERGLAPSFALDEAEFFESRRFRFVYNGLRALANPRDLLSREGLLADVPGLDEDGLVGLRDSPLPAMLKELKKRSDPALSALAGLLGEAAEKEPPVADILRRIREAISASPSDEDGERAALVRDRQFLDTRWGVYRSHTTPEQRVLTGFLGEVALAGRRNPEGDGVRVRTVHSAKGLEFRAVFLLGMNDGTFPDYRSTSGAGLAEERRNAYVAVTRAARLLCLSRPRLRRMPWGDLRGQTRSRFLDEMGLTVADV